MDNFNLVYYHKATKKKYLVKRLDDYEVQIFDPESQTVTRSTRGILRNDFSFSKKESTQKKFGKIRRF